MSAGSYGPFSCTSYVAVGQELCLARGEVTLGACPMYVSREAPVAPERKTQPLEVKGHMILTGRD